MRAIFAIICALLASLIVNGLLLSRCRTLTAERDKAFAELIISEQARAADNAALAVADKTRQEAAAKAQGRRDALLQNPHADTDDDVLRVCRDSLCATGAARRPDSASGAADALPETGNAGGHDAR